MADEEKITTNEECPETTIQKKIETGKVHQGILRNIIIVNFFFRLFSAGFMFLLPLYAVSQGWTDAYYGLVMAVGGYVTMGITFFLGILVDIQFKRTTIIIGIIVSLVSAIFFTRFETKIVVIIFYSLFVIGRQLLMLSINTFIANETKKGEHRTRGFIGRRIANGFAQMITVLSCGYLRLVLDFDWIFLILAAFAALSLGLVFILRLMMGKTPEQEIDHALKISEKSGDDYANFNHHEEGKKAIIGVQISFGVGRVIMGFTSGIAIPFISWYILKSFAPSDDIWGWINTILAGVMIGGYLLVGWIAEKIGKDLLVVISWALVIPAAVGIMLAKSLFWVAFFYVVRSFFARIPGAAWKSFLYEWISPENRGKTYGLLQTVQRGGRATGTLLGGIAFSALGPLIFPLMMTAYPIAGLLPLIQSKIVKRKYDKPTKVTQGPSG